MNSLFQYTSGLVLLIIISQLHGFANDGGSVQHKTIGFNTTILLVTDTVPPAIIKEVPKSRKQPVPVKIEVKPIPVIKPKIIKPVIKIIR